MVFDDIDGGKNVERLINVKGRKKGVKGSVQVVEKTLWMQLDALETNLDNSGAKRVCEKSTKLFA